MADDVTSMQLVPEPPPPLPPAAEGWGNAPTLGPQRSAFERPLAAIRRYKWLIAAVVLVATAGGVIATRFVKPDYEATATVWIQSQTPQDAGGPIRSRELLNPTAWVDLLRSFRVVDAVVRNLALYVKPAKNEDASLFTGFAVADQFFPGDYTLATDKKGTSWLLALEDQQIADSGAVGDSVGRKMGLRWKPDPNTLRRYAGKDVKFSVASPRAVSLALNKRLTAVLPLQSALLRVTLTDSDKNLAAVTLNALTQQFLQVAGELKKKNVTEFARILEGQLLYAETSLKDAETALENFKVKTIALPSEGTQVTVGLEDLRAPVMKSFFEKKVEYENVKNDREWLEKTMADARAGVLPLQALLFIPSVAVGPSGAQLRGSFQQLDKLQVDLAGALAIYTEQYPAVKQIADAVETLQTKTIPQQAASLVAQLKDREADFERRISTSSGDLQQIPARTIEEMRLRRSVAVASALYGTLRSRYEEAKLAEATASPDVSILDPATVPQKPTKNTKPSVLGIAILGGIAAAIGLALLLDNIDKRIRYPEQSTKELGLPISGTVPRLPKGQQTPEEISQLVESFRTLRMNVMHSGNGQVSMAVSSPSPGDGKSFIASNLAMSFAGAGFRTLLVDGDTRRGALHEMFGLARTAGLTDFLAGDVDQRAIIHATEHDNLFLIPTGTLRRSSPELLTSPLLGRLVTDLRAQFDVLIFDTTPLAAGIDGYAVAAATGSVLVVLRIGQTERRMAAAKLLLVDRLPINVIGSVLNAAPREGEYEYYGYVEGYGTTDLEPSQQVARIS